MLGACGCIALQYCLHSAGQKRAIIVSIIARAHVCAVEYLHDYACILVFLGAPGLSRICGLLYHHFTKKAKD